MTRGIWKQSSREEVTTLAPPRLSRHCYHGLYHSALKIEQGSTCVNEEVRVEGGKFTEQGEAGSPQQVPTFLLATPLHNRLQAAHHGRGEVGGAKQKQSDERENNLRFETT